MEGTRAGRNKSAFQPFHGKLLMHYRFLLLAIFVVASAYGQAPDTAQKIDSILKNLQAEGRFNGVTLVAHKGNILYEKGWGEANRQFAVNVTPETRFPIASITKMYTSVLVLMLEEKGLVKLDSTVAHYIDVFPAAGRRITVRSLLTHSSGLPNETVAAYTKAAKNPGDFLLKNSRDSLLFEPGSKFNYNNVDYIVLGAIIEKVSGKSWYEVLKTYILDPLQLKNTGLVKMSSIIPQLAYGYHNYSFGKGKPTDPVYNDFPIYMENYATAGALYATARDLLTFSEALYQNRLLSEAGMKELLRPDPKFGFIAWAGGEVALGCYVRRLIRNEGSLRIVERDGNINGFNTAWLHLPEAGTTIILLCNTDTGDMKQITDALLSVLYP